ncbi:50S ribosomal protein L1 [Candidatus Blochmannia ocreatus (nom. nud.)]|uniref:Large ribosomal subunit protein uL1 n=1 Tax=Candidatus Blochmannia ocreatus (nom. nud.) TaxID=251538 RepID=A0ABY4SVK6_9ENTR|nr:50S ribosomal protein L1 [Candidatus Blochmannia ocreatus]URJ25035.1 50S ribosomal protein L1 [Candidatus Blochmannia ocreatus]
MNKFNKNKKNRKKNKKIYIMQKDCDNSQQYNISDGLEILKKMKKAKFIESVDVAINLGIDTRKSDQNIRSSVVLPHGIGRNIQVAVFAQGENIKLAKDAGADIVGLEDLCNKIKIEKYLPDVIIASSDVMPLINKLGPILGPKGLMPNIKMGTISNNISESVKKAKLGQIRYKNDKNGIIHATIGKINFDTSYLRENLETLILSIKHVKPYTHKGTYIKKINISTTMGKSVTIDQNSI